MSELLTNEEIESLMLMVNSEPEEFDSPASMAEMGVDPARSLTSVGPVDLLTPNRVSHEQLQRLEHMFAGSAQAIGSMMSDQLRYDIHCDCVGLDQTRFSNWAPVASENAAVYVLHAPPLDIPIFFSVTKSLLYGWVEIENRFTNPSLVHLLPSQDVMVSVHFQAGSDLLLGDLRLGIAYSSIERYLGQLGATTERFAQAPGAMRSALTETVQPGQVNVRIEPGSTHLPLAPVQGVPKFAGRVGIVGASLGFQIESVLE
jgi:flagellar motor switch protein FliM